MKTGHDLVGTRWRGKPKALLANTRFTIIGYIDLSDINERAGNRARTDDGLFVALGRKVLKPHGPFLFTISAKMLRRDYQKEK